MGHANTRIRAAVGGGGEKGLAELGREGAEEPSDCLHPPPQTPQATRRRAPPPARASSSQRRARAAAVVDECGFSWRVCGRDSFPDVYGSARPAPTISR